MRLKHHQLVKPFTVAGTAVMIAMLLALAGGLTM
jgi:hypothetical protein